MTPVKTLCVLVTGMAGCVLVGLVGGDRFAPKLLFNTTASAPLGFYVLQPGPLIVGDWVAVSPPPRLAQWMAVRGYLPANVPLLKQVAALPGQEVCGRAGVLSIDGRSVTRVRGKDRRGRRLTPFSACRRLVAGEVMLVNTQAADSFDSRYFGPLPSNGVIGRAKPLWTWEARR